MPNLTPEERVNRNRISHRKYYLENIDYLRSLGRAKRAQYVKEGKDYKIYSANYYLENKEKVRAKQKEYYDKKKLEKKI